MSDPLTAFTLCSDAELAAAIGRLSVRLERLERNPHPAAVAESLAVAEALDQALDEQQRRQAREVA